MYIRHRPSREDLERFQAREDGERTADRPEKPRDFMEQTSFLQKTAWISGNTAAMNERSRDERYRERGLILKTVGTTAYCVCKPASCKYIVYLLRSGFTSTQGSRDLNTVHLAVAAAQFRQRSMGARCLHPPCALGVCDNVSHSILSISMRREEVFEIVDEGFLTANGVDAIFVGFANFGSLPFRPASLLRAFTFCGAV
eukprot:810972-Pleurochrysis_carterae.AAC.1